MTTQVSSLTQLRHLVSERHNVAGHSNAWLDLIGTTQLNVSRWGTRVHNSQSLFRSRLASISFGLTIAELVYRRAWTTKSSPEHIL